MQPIYFVGIFSFSFLFNLLCGFVPSPDENPTDDQLMDIMRPELNSISPNDRSSFVELCIVKKDECSEEQFSGKRAIFSWQPGLLQEKKVRFWQTYKCIFNRQLEECPVDGRWSKWTIWSRCKADCDMRSWQVRTRSCDNPKPAYGGDNCRGQATDNRTCVGACSNGNLI
ncbi:netrin receptor UNC5A [Elysia marginata]|uniref:Netrin receptor UNC5A n=1 Tax=Elysia marginata TaxID=1093978 RepID=A0AAV4GZC7_9GAST|nr:netrin receptor UNC5A [Elysia marginata]